jgi:imidazolonepropionase-like amidohydrolase
MRKLIKTKALIDGTGADAAQGACLLIKDGVIEDVGDAARLGTPPEGTEIVDLTKYYVMPGLVNGHTHLSIVPGEGDQLGQMRAAPVPKALKSTANLAREMRSGVTTSRIMGEEHFIDIDIKDAIERGVIEGPRLIVAGVPLVASNGHGVALTVSDGEDEVRRNARRNLARGADFIKIFATGGLSTAKPAADSCTFSRAEIAAAVEEAARSDTSVAAHAHGGLGVDLCIEEGVRTIEHGALVQEDQLDRIIKRDMWIVATSSILFSPEGIEKTDFNNKLIREKVLAARDLVRGNLARIVKSPVNLAVGTDSMHGAMGFEMEALVDFGASPMQAILAATRNGARLCGIADKVGTIEKGKMADFIALPANPLDDIRHMRDVAFVYKAGKQWHLSKAAV